MLVLVNGVEGGTAHLLLVVVRALVVLKVVVGLGLGGVLLVRLLE